MRERPILFSAPMVRAILEGRKTQTRRVLKRQPTEHHWDVLPNYRHQMKVLKVHDGLGVSSTHWRGDHCDPGEVQWFNCPYGGPGDQLWVKETWRPFIAHGHGMDACDCADVHVKYAADNNERFFSEREIPDGWLMPKAARGAPDRWVTPLFMPRWASRITLEVTGVRVERLQDITEADAMAEGLEALRDGDGGWTFPGLGSTNNPVAAFGILWSTINGAESWDANPWVWVVEFRRVEDARRAA